MTNTAPGMTYERSTSSVTLRDEDDEQNAERYAGCLFGSAHILRLPENGGASVVQ